MKPGPMLAENGIRGRESGGFLRRITSNQDCSGHFQSSRHTSSADTRESAPRTSRGAVVTSETGIP